MKYFSLFLVILMVQTGLLKSQPKLYSTKTGQVNFYSKTPLEDIEAISQSVFTLLKTETNEITYLVKMTSFKFKSALMQEHFNEKYVESDKYPNGSFKGKINEKINWTRDTVATVTATGTFNVHGVDQPLTSTGKLTIKEDNITIEGTFDLKLADYKIDIPGVVVGKIAEVINVTHKTVLRPYEARK